MFEHLDNRHPRPYSEADREEVMRRVASRRRRRRHARLAGGGALGVIVVVVAAITFFGPTSPTPSKVRVGAPPANATSPAPTAVAPTPPTETGPVEEPTGHLLFPETAVAAGPSTFYVVGASDRCDCMALDRTVNNARSFTRVSLPTDVADENDVGFETPTDGYAIGGPNQTSVVAWVTDNAARSWTAVKFAAHVGIVAATATATAIYLIAGHCKPDGSCRCTHGCDLVRIRAGTSTPTTTRLPSTTSNQPSYVPGAIELAATGNSVWIFDTDTHRALTSTNDGRNFERLPLALTAAACHYSATSSTVIWSQCNHAEYRSDNGGRAFTSIASSPDVYAWEPTDPATVYSAGSAQPYGTVVLRLSTNAGQTFTTQSPPTPDQYCVFTFTDDTTGIALCFGGPHAGAAVFATRDSGRSWIPGAQP